MKKKKHIFRCGWMNRDLCIRKNEKWDLSEGKGRKKNHVQQQVSYHWERKFQEFLRFVHIKKSWITPCLLLFFFLYFFSSLSCESSIESSSKLFSRAQCSLQWPSHFNFLSLFSSIFYQFYFQSDRHHGPNLIDIRRIFIRPRTLHVLITKYNQQINTLRNAF